MMIRKGTMKFLLAVLLVGGASSIIPVSATWAGVFDGPVILAQNGGNSGGRGNRSGREAQPPRDTRVARPPPQPQAPRGRGQMSEEQRQQLHRDLDRANRELYRGRR
jgi:hypothetical protein